VAAQLDSADPGVHSLFEVNSFDLDYPRYYQAIGDQLRLRGAGNAAVTVSGFTGSNVAVVNVTDPLKPQWVAAAAVTPAGAGKAVTFAPATATTDYVAAIPKAPVAVEGDAPSTLKTTNNAATYLVLTPSALRDGANALAAYRGGKVVELRDIYDEFSYGIANPHAIQDFLAYAAKNWKTKPKFVALLGKGSFDPKEYTGAYTNLFPVLMAPTPDGLFAADNRYADFNNDGTPDLAIGRIPALTNADVTNYLAKIQAYESSARRPANQAIVVADDPDEAGNFTLDSQAIVTALAGKGYVPTPIYVESIGATAARSQLVSALNSPAGVGIFNYVGHGGTDRLAGEGLLSNWPDDANVDTLVNAARQAILLAFTCNVGDSSYPGYESLTESLLRRQEGGVVATFSPTGLSDDKEAHKLNLSLVGTLGGPTSRPTLGEAVAAAIANFAAQGGQRYLRETYSILGDPGLRIQQ
jgi:hypothetical protein